MPRTLQNAKFYASEKVCSLSKDRQSPFVQTANMVDEVDKETGNLLRAWREHRQMTQEYLAAQVGTTGAVISLLEAGERKLSPKWLHRIAPAFGIRPGYLLDVHPEDADDEVIAAWSEVPREQRNQVREIIQTFRYKDGTTG